jgi:hypothetical protein
MTTTSNERQSILVDEGEARKFCQEYLMLSRKPRLAKVMARNKYAPDQKLSSGTQSHESMILSFESEDSEDRFVRFLRRVDILARADFYRDPKDTHFVIDPAWMVVYITAYPLDEEDATDVFMEKIAERRRHFRKAVTNKSANPVPVSRVTSLLESALRQSPCREHRLLKLDVDTKDPELLQDLYRALAGCTVVVAAETRGGYHVVIERGPSCQGLHKFVKTVQAGVRDVQDHWITIENGSGPMLAVPGTNQGGFTVRLVTEQWRHAVASPPVLLVSSSNKGIQQQTSTTVADE